MELEVRRGPVATKCSPEVEVGGRLTKAKLNCIANDMSVSSIFYLG